MFTYEIHHTALVIVDLQNDFVREGAPMEVPDAKLTIEINKKLIAFAREAAMPVIYTRFVTGPKEMLLWKWSPQIPDSGACRRGKTRYYSDIKKELECFDIIDEIYPEKGDYIVDKYWYSAFRNTNLIDILRSEGRNTIIVTGTVTQICVENTVHEGFSYGLNIIVARDAVSSFMPELQSASLKNIEMKFGVVMSSDEIIKSYRTVND